MYRHSFPLWCMHIFYQTNLPKDGGWRSKFILNKTPMEPFICSYSASLQTKTDKLDAEYESYQEYGRLHCTPKEYFHAFYSIILDLWRTTRALPSYQFWLNRFKLLRKLFSYCFQSFCLDLFFRLHYKGKVLFRAK